MKLNKYRCVRCKAEAFEGDQVNKACPKWAGGHEWVSLGERELPAGKPVELCAGGCGKEGRTHRIRVFSTGDEYPWCGDNPCMEIVVRALKGMSTNGTEPAPDPRRGSIQNVLRELPGEAAARKEMPIGTGVLDYFPLAMAELARVSKAGNDQHNPGQPLHWSRGKSADHADCIIRHFIERGTIDPVDGQRHSAKLLWRAAALLQEELEAEAGFDPTGSGA